MPTKLEQKEMQILPAEQRRALLQEAKAAVVCEMYRLKLAAVLQLGIGCVSCWQQNCNAAAIRLTKKTSTFEPA